MAKKLWLLVGFALGWCACLATLAGGLLYGLPGWLAQGRLGYIEQTTGLTFPAASTEVDTFDNGEFYTVAHLRLPVTEIAPWAAQFNAEPVELLPWITVLRPENRQLPAAAHWCYFSGQNTSQRWLAALDENSGRLWVVVFYLDPGGVGP